ncbi:MAG: FtsQ-type POTRA domain-containing protein [Bacilli bacterium]|nr:FtsQ-type POTRA domain-containing protein [Bacilli bacterium]
MGKTVRVKRKKLNIVKFLLILLILYLFFYGGYYLLTFPIKNIFVIPDTPFFRQIINDQTVLDDAKIDNYPSFFLTLGSTIRKRLLKNPHIKEVKVQKKWLGKVYIYITEQPKLFFDLTKEKIVLGDQSTISFDIRINHVPTLINYVPDTVYDIFCQKMTLINNDMRIKISEIQYKPNDVDEERFLLTMDDGNYVYVTLYTFEKINQYNSILSQLGDKNGILYLDAGNYFEIFD